MADELLSGTKRRILSAVSDLPPKYEANRQRGEMGALASALGALRRRLDALVHFEEQYGDEQKAANWNRAERNALIDVLAKAGADLGMLTPEPTKPRRPSTEYVFEQMEAGRGLLADGYVIVHRQKPGIVFHRSGEDVASVEVPLVVWFYIAGLSEHSHVAAD